MLVALACSSAEAQKLSFEQRVADLDAKSAELKKHLDESESRSRRFNAFLKDAKARLETMRAAGTPLEPMEFPKPVSLPSGLPPSPPLERPTPLPSSVQPPPVQPPPVQPPPVQPPPVQPPPVQPPPVQPVDSPQKPRGPKSYYLQTFGGFLVPGTLKVKTKHDNFPNAPIKSRNGFSSGIVLGREFGNFRLESEISGRRQSHRKIDVRGFPDPHTGTPYPSTTKFKNLPISGYSMAVGGLVSAVYDMDFTENSSLFFGLGVGANEARIMLPGKKLRDTLLAYQFLSGFAWDFTERGSVRFVYKYFSTTGSKDFDRLDSHNLELGVQVDL